MRCEVCVVACVLLTGAFGCSSAGESVTVSGIEMCTEVAPVGDERNRYECVEDLDDERVSGQSIVTVNEFDAEASPNAMVGTMAIENEDGAWAGDWAGTIDDTGLHVANGVLEGSGAYDGQQFTATWEWVDWPATVTGTIEP